MISCFSYIPELDVGQDVCSPHRQSLLPVSLSDVSPREPQHGQIFGCSGFMLIWASPRLSLATKQDRIRSELSKPLLRLCVQFWRDRPSLGSPVVSCRESSVWFPSPTGTASDNRVFLGTYRGWGPKMSAGGFGKPRPCGLKKVGKNGWAHASMTHGFLSKTCQSQVPSWHTGHARLLRS